MNQTPSHLPSFPDFIATMGQLTSHTTISVFGFPKSRFGYTFPYPSPLRGLYETSLGKTICLFITCQPCYTIHLNILHFPISSVCYIGFPQKYSGSSNCMMLHIGSPVLWFRPMILSAASFTHNLTVINLPSKTTCVDVRPFGSLWLPFWIGNLREWTFTT